MANATAVFTPGQRFVDETGTPYVGCSVEFYNAGTTTQKIVYADAELTTELGPIVYTDSAGYPVTAIGSTSKTIVYTDSSSYKIRILDASSVVVAEHDNCKGAVVASATEGGSFLTQDAADVRYIRNANALASVSSITTGDKVPLFSAASAGNRNIDYSDLITQILADWRASGHIFSAGVRLAFQQTTVPTGWVKETSSTYNDATQIITTGTANTGGTAGASTVFKSWTPTGTVGNYTLATADIAAHAHTVTASGANRYGSIGTNYGTSWYGSAGDTSLGGTASVTSANAGSGGAHNHSLTMNTMNLDSKYVLFCIGEKS